MKQLNLIIVVFYFLTSTVCRADFSSTISVNSDYLFNGISQTNNNPALQASLDWTDGGNLYAGAWSSNVDFGERTRVEFDIYGGYIFPTKNYGTIDIGAAYYTYHGQNDSSNGDYAEVFAKWQLQNTTFSYWYSWDYFGTSSAHSIVQFEQSFLITTRTHLVFVADRSLSHDDSFQWQLNDRDYWHGGITLNYNADKYTVSIGYHQTDRDTFDDNTWLLSYSRTFTY